jgi:DNA polymerase-3 subunit alpha (Gram-positive type)
MGEDIQKVVSESRAILAGLNFTVIDLETTGGNLKYDKIIEIGLVKVSNLKIIEKKDFLINPEIPIPQFVQNLTSISEEKIKEKPLIQEVIDDVLEFIGDDIIVAHNTSFDVPFLNSVLRRLKKPALKNKVLCTHVMTKFLIPEMMSSNLPYICKVFNIEHKKAHRALSDASSTAQILLNYLEIFIARGIRKINQLYYPRNKFELNQAHFERDQIEQLKNQVNQLVKIKHNFVLITKKDDGVITHFYVYNSEVTSEKNLNKILNSRWKKSSIKICESFVEGMLTYKDQFLNISENASKIFFKELKDAFNEKVDNKDFRKPKNEFLIIPHIVKDQFLIYDKEEIDSKRSLIFKYPGQEKKLEQFIYSNNKALKKRKLNHPQSKKYLDLKTMIFNYIENQANDVLSLKKDDFNRKNKKVLFTKITKLANSKKSQFPNFHL